MIENLTEEQVKELAKIAGGQGTKTVEEVLPECSAEDKEATKKQLELIKDGKNLDAIGGGLSKTAIGAICGTAGALVAGTAGVIGTAIYKNKQAEKAVEKAVEEAQAKGEKTGYDVGYAIGYQAGQAGGPYGT